MDVRVRLTALFLLLVALVACQTAERKDLAAFRTRLKAAERLSANDLSRLVGESVRAIGGKPLRIQQGPVTRGTDDRTRAETLALLTGALDLEDRGVRVVEGRTLRGLSGPGTPARSELDATQTLWIDVETLLPKQFALDYSMPGYGDYSYDLSFGR